MLAGFLVLALIRQAGLMDGWLYADRLYRIPWAYVHVRNAWMELNATGGSSSQTEVLTVYSTQVRYVYTSRKSIVSGELLDTTTV
jgi:hypothetical protein